MLLLLLFVLASLLNDFSLLFSLYAKALEDLSVLYDHTVRTSLSNIVQFKYGDDGLDPLNMETQEKPLDFVRVLQHVRDEFPDLHARELSPSELESEVIALLAVDGDLVQRTSREFATDLMAFFVGDVACRDFLKRYRRYEHEKLAKDTQAKLLAAVSMKREVEQSVRYVPLSHTHYNVTRLSLIIRC